MIAKIAIKQPDLNPCYKYVDLGTDFKVYSEKVQNIFDKFQHTFENFEKQYDWALIYNVFVVEAICYFQNILFPWKKFKEAAAKGSEELLNFLCQLVEKWGYSRFKDFVLETNPDDINLEKDGNKLIAIYYKTIDEEEHVKIILDQTVYIINDSGTTVDIYRK